jgi:hypothetical protein
MFLKMTPAGSEPYDAATVWDRNDVKVSMQLLNHFSDEHVLKLEMNHGIRWRQSVSDAGNPTRFGP